MAKSPAIEALTGFKFVDTSPFCGSASEIANDALKEAYAMLIVIGNAVTEGGDDPIIRGVHLGQALGGVMTLMSLSAFVREQGREGQ